MRWVNFFQIIYSFRLALGARVYSASNRKEYQKQKNNVSGDQIEAGA
jgi:hypothetical protein